MPLELSPQVTADFVRARTTLCTVEFVPEVRLHLADEAITLWQQTEDETGRIQLPPPFWAFAWAGGQALARYVLDHPDLVRGRRVFDLASGSGLVAVAAALTGAAHVTANEIDELATAAIGLNAAANGVDVDVVLGDRLDTELTDVDLVLAGDVFYSKPMTDRIIPFLRRAQRHGADVLVGDPGRAYLPTSRLTERAVYQVPVPLALEDAEVKRTTVWQLDAPPGRG